MNTLRQRLPNRRQTDTIRFDHEGQRYFGSASLFEGGNVAEVFLDAGKTSPELLKLWMATGNPQLLLASQAPFHSTPARVRREPTRDDAHAAQTLRPVSPPRPQAQTGGAGYQQSNSQVSLPREPQAISGLGEGEPGAGKKPQSGKGRLEALITAAIHKQVAAGPSRATTEIGRFNDFFVENEPEVRAAIEQAHAEAGRRTRAYVDGIESAIDGAFDEKRLRDRFGDQALTAAPAAPRPAEFSPPMCVDEGPPWPDQYH
jgi:hypothetical protein